jgi:hypothetical protein
VRVSSAAEVQKMAKAFKDLLVLGKVGYILDTWGRVP